MWRNPISDKRRPIIRQMLFKHLVRNHNSQWGDQARTPEESVGILRQARVGPFKARLHQLDNGYYQLSAPYLAGSQSWPPLAVDITAEAAEVFFDTIIEGAQARLTDVVELIERNTDAVLGWISRADPTASGEYSRWLVIQYADGHIRLPEDIDKIQEDLHSFDDLKTRGIIPSQNRDINGYETYGNFFETLRAFGGVLSDREKLQRAMESGVVIYRNDAFKVMEVREWLLAKSLAAGTNWCVRGTEMAKHYLRNADHYPLYFFFRDDEQFALLSNHPEERQFMDVDDVPIRKTDIENIEGFKLAIQAVPEASWVACEECGTVYPSPDRDYLSRMTNQVSSAIRGQNTQVLSSGVIFGSGAHMVCEVPPAIIDYPVIASNRTLDNQIVIGPAQAILENYREYVWFPAVNRFFERAGYGELGDQTSVHQVIGKLVEQAAQPAVCECGALVGGLDADELVAEVLHALYVIQPCEDFGVLAQGYVVCGHEISPKYRGPTCPPRLMNYGAAVGMRCECGAFVPSGSRHSICPACLNGMDFSKPEDGNTFEGVDDCPLSMLYLTLKIQLGTYKESMQRPWNFRYSPTHATGGARNRNLIWVGEPFELSKTKIDGRSYRRKTPFLSWKGFKNIRDLLHLFGDSEEVSDEVNQVIYQHLNTIEAIYQQGYFDQMALAEHIIPALEAIYAPVSKQDHSLCCDDY